MSIKKQSMKTEPSCKVTFKLPKNMVNNARHVALVGEFNNWNASSTPMKKLKDGSFSTSLKLEAGREYQFRYLIDGSLWENDDAADKYAYSEHASCDNSVVVV